jgi:hypothetical protein
VASHTVNATVAGVTGTDPWGVLGIRPGSSLAEARAARRRLAKDLHPDLHGGRAELSARMTLVNQAVAEIEALTAAGPVASAFSSPAAQAAGATDPASFSVELLPVEAFEALFLAVYGLGDILTADEPYLLEGYLTDPPCFCRLTLVPEAGGSLVTAEVTAASESQVPPEPAAVVEVLVEELNSLVAG